MAYICANVSLADLSVLDLGPMYTIDRRQIDRQTDVRHASSLNASAMAYGDGGIIKIWRQSSTINESSNLRLILIN